MTRLEVGSRLNSYYVGLLPPGSMMRYSGHQYRLTEQRMWERVNYGNLYSDSDFNLNQGILESLPNGLTHIDLPQETLAQYKWRFREHALAGAVAHGVSYTASEQALADMGAGPDEFPLGAGVVIKNPQTARGVPSGTVLYTGRPDVLRGYVVWVRNGGTWERILGEYANAPGEGRATYTVAAMNGSTEPPAWLKAEVTEEDERLIAEFKATAWRRGWQLKRDQSWCGTYETVMSQFGLTRDVLRQHGEHAVGSLVNPDQARTMPVGTLFSWTSSNDPNERCLFVRSNGMSNVAGTVKVGGTPESSGRNYHSSMMVVSFPTMHENWSNCLVELNNNSPWMEFIPVGSTFTNSEHGEFVYAIESNLGARQTRDTPGYRRWNLRDFGESNVIYFNNLEGIAL